MLDENLVRVNKYSIKIKELTVLKRIAIDYPLLCRKGVAEKLGHVADRLPSQFFLQVDSGYRTKKTEQILFEKRKYLTPGLVIDPKLSKSSHNTGGAVDVTLTDKFGREINLSEPFNKYYMEPKLISKNITPKAQNLRNMLNRVMLEAGFAPHPNEYWHFSYGDRRWAEYTKSKVLYDEINLNCDLYFSPWRRFFYRVLRKMYRIKNIFLKVETNV